MRMLDKDLREIVIETEEAEPKIIAVITEEDVECIQGYQIRLRLKHAKTKD